MENLHTFGMAASRRITNDVRRITGWRYHRWTRGTDAVATMSIAHQYGYRRVQTDPRRDPFPRILTRDRDSSRPRGGYITGRIRREGGVQALAEVSR